MYKLQVADKVLCHLPGYSSSNTYSIWFYERNPILIFRNYLLDVTLCTPSLFPAIYWTVLVLSILGIFLSVWEFLTVAQDNQNMTTFRQRYLRVLSFQFRKNCRLIGSIIMAFVNLLLFLGLITISTMSMIPWLTINGVIFLIEIGLWTIDVTRNNEEFNFSAIFSFTLFALSWCLTNCIRKVFDKAIEMDNTDAFHLFGRRTCF